MKKTPQGIQYDEFFEKLLKKSVSPTSQIKRIGEDKKLWIVSNLDEKNDIFFYGYDLGLNNTISIDICSDKDITSDVLNYVDIPHLKHKLFRISSEENKEDIGIIDSLIEKAKEWGMDVVIKPRSGSSGLGIYHVKNEIEIEKAVLKEKLERGVVMSPYQNIVNEYRVLVLENNPLCIYKKNRNFLLGDGKSTLLQLIDSQLDKKVFNEVVGNLLSEEVDLNTKTSEGEKYLVSWKHNLDGGGAEPEISKDSKMNEKLLDIAQRSVKAIGINYAAVDIIETDKNELLVLEVNSTPIFYNFIKFYGKENFTVLLKDLIVVRMKQEQQRKITHEEQQLEEKVEQAPYYFRNK